jgi:hypothetical protein
MEETIENLATWYLDACEMSEEYADVEYISRLIFDHFHFGKGCVLTHVLPKGFHSPPRAIKHWELSK